MIYFPFFFMVFSPWIKVVVFFIILKTGRDCNRNVWRMTAAFPESKEQVK